MSTPSNNSQMHYDIIVDGSKERPPMLASGHYVKWSSRFMRYIDTKANKNKLRHCIEKGPYILTELVTEAIPAVGDEPGQPHVFGNQRTVTVAKNMETVGNQAVQHSEIQCFNCKGFGHFTMECRITKRVKDYEYHKEKMMLSKQEARGKADQNAEEPEDQQLEKRKQGLKKSKQDLSYCKSELVKYKIFQTNHKDKKKAELECVKDLGLLAETKLLHNESPKIQSYVTFCVKEENAKLVNQIYAHESKISQILKEQEQMKKDFKEQENKDIDKLIALESQVKFLNNIVYKTGQSVQTMHMLTPKPSLYYIGLGVSSFSNPLYLKKAQLEKPCLYNVKYDKNDLANLFSPESDETVRLAEESRSKLSEFSRRNSQPHHLILLLYCIMTFGLGENNPFWGNLNEISNSVLNVLAMSSDNTSSAVTYTSISSDSDGPSWGIPLMNVGELHEIDPYEEVTQQGQATPLSPAYVPDPMGLEHHIPVYVLKPVYSEYHVLSDDDIQIKDQPYAADALPSTLSLGYIVESDSEEDLEEDSEEDPIDYATDTDDEEEDKEEEESSDDDKEKEHLSPAIALSYVDPVPSVEETKPFEIDESAATPPPPPTYRTTSRISVQTQTPILFPFEEEKRLLLTAPTPRFEIRESSTAATTRQLRSTVARRVDYGFVDTLDASIRGSERESEEFQTRHQDAKDDHAALRDEVDTLRMYRSSLCTTHKQERVEARQALDRSEAYIRALEARIAVLETQAYCH
ncbi:putative reverse transcriptase domain-containing protein, partial [Tanacetum coccineum]